MKTSRCVLLKLPEARKVVVMSSLHDSCASSGTIPGVILKVEIIISCSYIIPGYATHQSECDSRVSLGDDVPLLIAALSATRLDLSLAIHSFAL